MNLIFVGPQGSGKGTVGKIISEKLKISHISMGDLLRNYKGEYKKQVDEIIQEGKLAPLDLTLNIIKERLKQLDCKNGFILDGFPRNLEQAKALDCIIKIDKVVEISISEEESIKRLSGRWNCPKCGIPYNVLTAPRPKKEGICDKCESKLFHREDDNEKTIKKRLKVYHEETEPILDYYGSKRVKINGEQNIERVSGDVLKSLKLKY